MARFRTFLGGLFFIYAGLFCAESRALTLPGGTLPIENLLLNPVGFLTPEVANAASKAFGIIFDHRPLEPASPLGTHLGLDFGLEADLVQFSPELGTVLQGVGIPITLPPVFPNPRMINLHKGLGDSIDIGGSYFSYTGYLFWAVELKVVLSNPEEGLVWAVRLSRTSVSIPIGTLDYVITTATFAINTVTYTPELVVSRRVGIAEPYMGVGYQYATGTVGVTFSSFAVPGLEPVSGSGGSFLALVGVSLKAPVIGLRLTLEGTYSMAGYNALGTKIGFSF